MPVSLFIFIFACTQRNGWTSGCISMHQSWARNPSVDLNKNNNKKKKTGNPRQVCPEFEYGSVAEGRWWSKPYVYVDIQNKKHRDYTSAIVSYPRTVVPLNQTRLDKAHIHRRVCRQFCQRTRKQTKRMCFLNK